MDQRRGLLRALLGMAALAVFAGGCTGATTLPLPMSPLPTAEALSPQSSSPVWPTPVVIDWEPVLDLTCDSDHVTEQTIAFLRDGDLFLVEANTSRETRLSRYANVT